MFSPQDELDIIIGLKLFFTTTEWSPCPFPPPFDLWKVLIGFLGSAHPLTAPTAMESRSRPLVNAVRRRVLAPCRFGNPFNTGTFTKAVRTYAEGIP